MDTHEDPETPPSGLVEQVCANPRLYRFSLLRAVFVRVFYLLAAIALRITSNYDSDGQLCSATWETVASGTRLPP